MSGRMNDFLEIVRNDPKILESVTQVPALCLAAARENGMALKHIREQTPEICFAAVRENGLALEYVKEQTYEMCLSAVVENPFALEFVKDQTPEICSTALKGGYGFLSGNDPETHVCGVFELIREKTPELCLLAARLDGLSIQFMKEQSPEICMAAVENNPFALEYVENQTLAICQAAIKQEPDALEYVRDKALRFALTSGVHMAPDGTSINPLPESESLKDLIAKIRKPEDESQARAYVLPLYTDEYDKEVLGDSMVVYLPPSLPDLLDKLRIGLDNAGIDKIDISGAVEFFPASGIDLKYDRYGYGEPVVAAGGCARRELDERYVGRMYLEASYSAKAGALILSASSKDCDLSTEKYLSPSEMRALLAMPDPGTPKEKEKKRHRM